MWVTSALVEVHLKVVRVAFFKLGIFFVNFFFKVGQAAVEGLDVVLDTGESAVKSVVHLFALEHLLLLLLSGREWRTGRRGGLFGFSVGSGWLGCRLRGTLCGRRRGKVNFFTLHIARGQLLEVRFNLAVVYPLAVRAWGSIFGGGLAIE